jgi:DNA segregation ATPase FtsK/SpoIIIE-like protein
MIKNRYSYILPIGLAPSKIEGCREELEAALGGHCDFEINGRVVTITAYKGKLKKRIKYRRPEVDEGLIIPIGYGMEGELIILDMSSDSHCYLLAGGNPGTGKSVFLNGCIDCISQYPSEHVRFVFIDMKMGVELGSWYSLPHKWLTAEDPTRPELKHVLTQLLAEIKKRMKLFKAAGVKKISDYNRAFPDKKMNYIMVIVDEYAEIKNSDNGDEYEVLMKSALQIGRAAGLRAIVATQRPTTDCISGTVKAVFTDRIAFAVSSALNSRVILDSDGAEKLPNDVPGRAIFLTGSRFREVQVMDYSSPVLQVIPDTEYMESTV